MTELKMEHVLMVLIVAFVLYYFMGSCSCGNGFSVGGEGDCTDDGIIRFIENVENIPDCTISGTGEFTKCGPNCYDKIKKYYGDCSSEIQNNKISKELNKVADVCMKQNPVTSNNNGNFQNCLKKYQRWVEKNMNSKKSKTDCVNDLINTPECNFENGSTIIPNFCKNWLN